MVVHRKGEDRAKVQACTLLPYQTQFEMGETLSAAGLRELWEETGLILGRPANWQGDVPPEWKSYADAGYVPVADGIHFVFRIASSPKLLGSEVVVVTLVEIEGGIGVGVGGDADGVIARVMKILRGRVERVGQTAIAGPDFGILNEQAARVDRSQHRGH